MHISSLPLDLYSFLQFLFTAFVIAFGLLHLMKNTASKYRRRRKVREDMLSVTSSGGGHICASCGNSASKRCTGCKAVRYCSETCQSKHWKGGHKLQCNEFKIGNLRSIVPSSSCGSDSSSVLQRPKKVLFPYEEFVKPDSNVIRDMTRSAGEGSRPGDMTGVYQALRDRDMAAILQHQANQRAQRGQAKHAALPVHVVETEEQRMEKLVDRFLKLKLPTFKGSTDPLEAEKWLKAVRKTLNLLGGNDQQRVKLVSHLLEGEADFWWDATCRSKDVEQMTWLQFEEIFLDHYFPKSARNQKRLEFMQLNQLNLTVAQYETKFAELSRYAENMVGDEVSKVWKFQEGLRPSIRGKLAALRLRVYADVVDTARVIEIELEDAQRIQEQQNKTRDGRNRNDHNKRPMTNFQHQQSRQQEQGPENPRGCFSCGQFGHYKKDCPNKRQQLRPQGFQQQSRPYYSQQAPVRPSNVHQAPVRPSNVHQAPQHQHQTQPSQQYRSRPPQQQFFSRGNNIIKETNFRVVSLQ